MTNSEIKKRIKEILNSISLHETQLLSKKETIIKPLINELENLFSMGNHESNFSSSVGKTKKYQRASVYVLSQLRHCFSDDFIIDQIINKYEKDSSSLIIQHIGIEEIQNLLFVLHYCINKKISSLMDFAIRSIGEIADPSSLDLLFPIMAERSKNMQRTLIWVLKKFDKHEKIKQYLQWVYNNNAESDSFEKGNKVIAAWGLVKQGETDYYEYLIKMLDDLDTITSSTYELQTKTIHEPGESLRAAQAICDINGWDFEWHSSYVEITKKHLKIK